MKCCHGRKKAEVKALSVMTIFDQQVDNNTLFVYDFPIDATIDTLVELEMPQLWVVFLLLLLLFLRRLGSK